VSTTVCRTMKSPIGPLVLAGHDGVLTHIELPHEVHPSTERSSWVEDERVFGDVVSQLDAYFAGSLREFTVAMELSGTPFQEAVWEALQTIPYGSTRSYGEIAAAIGKNRAMRAVGLAAGRNPVPIVVPCHRVIGADGSLTGYGGGLETKRHLIELERGAGASDQRRRQAKLAASGDPDRAASRHRYRP
jgi:methylated-DNA-[protein]-cysteine S-methyltransferase